jgi:hypothetical protein
MYIWLVHNKLNFFQQVANVFDASVSVKTDYIFYSISVGAAEDLAELLMPMFEIDGLAFTKLCWSYGLGI